MMKEIEVKIKIPDASDIISLLKGKGCVFSEPKAQQDLIYIEQSVPAIPVAAGVNVLRIRRQGDRSIFTLKQSTIGNNLAKLELEVDITDPETMEKIIPLLGYKKIAKVNKTRRTCKYLEYEICVDQVEELGDYLEIEKITDQDPGFVQTEMLATLFSLGLDTSDRQEYGYDVMYVQKKLKDPK